MIRLMHWPPGDPTVSHFILKKYAESKQSATIPQAAASGVDGMAWARAQQSHSCRERQPSGVTSLAFLLHNCSPDVK